MSSRPVLSPFAAAALMALLATLALSISGDRADAQIFGPPMTVFGSVTDSAGAVEEGLKVEAYIGDTLCGEGETEGVGDGDARVTVYYADVVSAEQTEGCGTQDAEVRMKIGERFADQTTTWEAGPRQLDITFGDATPAPIPTFTPTPPGSGTAAPGTTSPGGESTPTPPGEATAPADASPGASPSASATVTGTAAGSPGSESPEATEEGGVVSSQGGEDGGDSGSEDDGDGGFPVWAAIVLVIGGIALVGGGVGYAMSRSRNNADDTDTFSDESDQPL